MPWSRKQSHPKCQAKNTDNTEKGRQMREEIATEIFNELFALTPVPIKLTSATIPELLNELAKRLDK